MLWLLLPPTACKTGDSQNQDGDPAAAETERPIGRVSRCLLMATPAALSPSSLVTACLLPHR